MMGSLVILRSQAMNSQVTDGSICRPDAIDRSSETGNFTESYPRHFGLYACPGVEQSRFRGEWVVLGMDGGTAYGYELYIPKANMLRNPPTLCFQQRYSASDISRHELSAGLHSTIHHNTTLYPRNRHTNLRAEGVGDAAALGPDAGLLMVLQLWMPLSKAPQILQLQPSGQSRAARRAHQSVSRTAGQPVSRSGRQSAGWYAARRS